MYKLVVEFRFFLFLSSSILLSLNQIPDASNHPMINNYMLYVKAFHFSHLLRAFASPRERVEKLTLEVMKRKDNEGGMTQIFIVVPGLIKYIDR